MTDPDPQPNPSGPRARFAWLTGRWGILLLALALLIAGAILFALETPLWWFGGSLIVAALTLALRESRHELSAFMRAPRRLLGRETDFGRAGLELFYLGVVVWIGSTMMADILGGERPVSHDHTIHYFKAWQLHERLLPHGDWLGWSHRWFAGYPVNYLYPPGADFWINAVYGLGFGTFSFSKAYAYGFWLFHLFTGLSVYALGRRIGGPHVAVIAALLCLTDLSDFRMGGWDYTVEYGVWPQTLSLNFSLLAICALPDIVERRSNAALGWFGLWMGFAIITHPIQLIVLGLLLLGTALAAAFAEDVRAPGALFRVLIAYALSILVAAMWLGPFLSSRDETNQMGVWWDTTYEMGKGLLDLNALPGTLGWVIACGVLALVVMFRSRRFLLLLTAFMALCIPAVSNSTFVDELHLPALASAFAKVQFVRLSTMVKPFWFVLAGYFVVAVLTHARKLTLGSTPGRSGVDSHGKAVALSGVIALLTLPVVLSTVDAFWSRHVAKTLTTESSRPYLGARLGLERWLKTQLPKDGFYRVGVFMGHNHDLLDLGTEIGRPIYKRGFTPASNFIYQPEDNNPAIFDAVNLRFAISKIYLQPELFEQVAAFGIYRVYRYKRWQPNPFDVFDGGGDVRLERWGDEEIAVRAGPGSHGKLRLNVSYFSRWHAYRDGEPVPITITYLRESARDTGFITVPLAPGRYTFRFERTFADRASGYLSLLGLLICGLLIGLERRRTPVRPFARIGALVTAVGERLDRISSPSWARFRRISLALGVITVIVLGTLLGRMRPPLQPDANVRFLIDRVRYDFLESLGRASANIEYRERNTSCLRQRDRLVCRDENGRLDNNRYIASSPATIEEYTMVRCIRARPEDRAVVSITFPRVPMGDRIVGYYGIERSGRLMFRRRPVQLTIDVDGTNVYQAETMTDNKMHWFSAMLDGQDRRRKTVTFSVRAENITKRYFCFDAQVVDVK